MVLWCGYSVGKQARTSELARGTVHRFGGTAVISSASVPIALVTKQTLGNAPKPYGFGDATRRGTLKLLLSFSRKAVHLF